MNSLANVLPAILPLIIIVVFLLLTRGMQGATTSDGLWSEQPASSWFGEQDKTLLMWLVPKPEWWKKSSILKDQNSLTWREDGGVLLMGNPNNKTLPPRLWPARQMRFPYERFRIVEYLLVLVLHVRDLFQAQKAAPAFFLRE